MKKLIAIVTIAIVLVGAVFAANTEQSYASTNEKLTIVTTVTRVEPTFKLVGGTASDSITQESDSVSNDNWSTAYNGATLTLAASDYNIATGDIKLFFAIRQKTNANIHKAYTFTVTASDLVYQKADNQDTKEFTIQNGGIEHLTANTTLTGATTSTYPALTASVDGSNLVATYTGVVNVPTTGDQYIEIGTFDVTWPETVDAIAGTYKADIKMTFTVN